jgi:O-antigen/teichoic acid export membrane protein
MSNKGKAIKGSIWFAFFYYLSFAVNFLGNLVLARLLTPNDFGTFALALSIGEILYFMGGFLFSKSYIHLQDEPDIFETSFTISCLAGIALFLIGSMIALLTSNIYSSQVIVFLLVIVAVKGVQYPNNVLLANYERQFDFKKSGLIFAIANISAMIIAIAVAYMYHTAWSLIIRQVLIALITLAIVLFLHRSTVKFKINKATLRKIWHYSGGLFISKITVILQERAPKLLLGTFVNTQVLGFFERTQYLSFYPKRLVNPISHKVAFSIFSKYKDDKERVSFGLFWNLWLLIRVFLPVALALFLIPEKIVLLLLGKQWIEAVPFLKAFSLTLFLLPLRSILIETFYSLGKTKLVAKIGGVGVGILLLSFPLVHLLDLDWSLFVWIISFSFLIQLILFFISTFRQKILKDFFRLFSIPLLVGLVLSGVYFIFFKETPLLLLAGLILYAGIEFLFEKKQYQFIVSKVLRVK